MRKNAIDEFAFLAYAAAMSELLTPIDLEKRAAAAGLSTAEMCKRAGVAVSTFTRWKGGKTQPTLDVYRRLRDATAQRAPAPSEAT